MYLYLTPTGSQEHSQFAFLPEGRLLSPSSSAKVQIKIDVNKSEESANASHITPEQDAPNEVTLLKDD